MLFQCWAGVEDGGPTLKQHWVNASCLLGINCFTITSGKHFLNVKYV